MQMRVKLFIQLGILFQLWAQRRAYDAAVFIHNHKIHMHPVLKLVHGLHGVRE